MAGEDSGDSSKLTGISKIFNSQTVRGRANVNILFNFYNHSFTLIKFLDALAFLLIAFYLTSLLFDSKHGRCDFLPNLISYTPIKCTLSKAVMTLNSF